MAYRQTRFEYLASFFRKRKKKAVAERPERTPAKIRRWKYSCPFAGGAGTVTAYTKSEARAEIKKRHGIGSKGRVPVGSLITCI